ncbi:hypothetical protein [Streptomyces zhihengii]
MERTDSDAAPPPLGVGMIGYAFMGAAHSQGWRTAAPPRVGAFPRAGRRRVGASPGAAPYRVAGER